MRDLADLIRYPEGRALLEERGVVLDLATFQAGLVPPARADLARLVGLDGGSTLVCSAHQIQCDYPGSVVAKLRTLRSTAAKGGPTAALLWLDMDRTGSNLLSSRLTWPTGPHRSVRLALKRYKEREPRFVPVERERLEEAAARIQAWGDGAQRAGRIAEAVTDDGIRSLAQAAHALTGALVREHLGFDPPSILVSELANGGLLTEPLRRAVAHVDDVVRVFNEAREALVTRDVDPLVRPLADDYLPLRYSCPACGTRRAFTRERRGSDEFAVDVCRCGEVHRFHLGADGLDELLDSGRWSADVTLPCYFNGLMSGVVGGRSSALYGLVLGEVMEKVLGERPVPMLVPPDLGAVLADRSSPDSLLYECLTAR